MEILISVKLEPGLVISALDTNSETLEIGAGSLATVALLLV